MNELPCRCGFGTELEFGALQLQISQDFGLLPDQFLILGYLSAELLLGGSL